MFIPLTVDTARAFVLSELAGQSGEYPLSVAAKTESDIADSVSRYNTSLGSLAIQWEKKKGVFTYCFYPQKVGKTHLKLVFYEKTGGALLDGFTITVTDNNPTTVTAYPENGSTQVVNITGGETFTFQLEFERDIVHDDDGNVLDKNGNKLVDDEDLTEYGSNLMEVYLDRTIDWGQENSGNSAPSLRQAATMQKVKRTSIIAAKVNKGKPNVMDVTIDVGSADAASLAQGMRNATPMQKVKRTSIIAAKINTKLSSGAVGLVPTEAEVEGEIVPESPECAFAYNLIDESSSDFITTGSYGLSTYYASQCIEVKLSDDVKVYDLESASAGEVVLVRRYGKVRGACLVRGDANKEFCYERMKTETPDCELANFRVQTEEGIIPASTTGYYNYLFGKLKGEETPSFHELQTDYTVSGRPYVVYMQSSNSLVPKGTKSVKVTFRDGEEGTTAIFRVGADGTLVPAEADNDAPLYNLQGQKVGDSFKGIVIKNGRKMLVR
ncbi:MAG: hypothetical protein HUK08_04615 [Bacteroidaceae bacterium]|nr:hypothetical protein [Bacteroidaceae bacterium]